MIPNLNVLQTNVTLNAFGGFDLPVVGKVYVNCSRNVKPVESHKLEFIVIKSKVKTVLGLESAIRLKFINTIQVQAHASGADPCSTLGGIIPHFYRFFGILKFWGGYSGFADFSSFNDFENLGVYSGFNENELKQFKTRNRMHKINK